MPPIIDYFPPEPAAYVSTLDLRNAATASSVQKPGNVTILYSDNYATMRKKITPSYTNNSVADILTHSIYDLLCANGNGIVTLSPSAYDNSLFGRITLTLGEPAPSGTIDVHIPEDCSLTYLVINAVETGNSYIPTQLKNINAGLINSPSVNGYKILKFNPSDYDEKSGFGGFKKCVSFVLKKSPTNIIAE